VKHRPILSLSYFATSILISPCMTIALIMTLMCMSEIPTLAADTLSVQRAEQWLTKIDQRQYAESWTSSAVYLKQAIDQAQWTKTLTSHRQPFGLIVSRHHQKTEYRNNLPGVPNGHYAILYFLTNFETKLEAIETLVLQQEPDGAWRSIGYTIK